LSVNAQHSSEKGKNDAATKEEMFGGTFGEVMLALSRQDAQKK